MIENKKTSQAILIEILSVLKKNAREFALGMNEPYSIVYDVYRGKTKAFSTRLKVSMRDTYGLSTDYLATGEGEMFDHSRVLSNGIIPNQTTQPFSSDIEKSFHAVLTAYSNENAQLKAQILVLKEKIKELEQQLKRE